MKKICIVLLIILMFLLVGCKKTDNITTTNDVNETTTINIYENSNKNGIYNIIKAYYYQSDTFDKAMERVENGEIVFEISTDKFLTCRIANGYKDLKLYYLGDILGDNNITSNIKVIFDDNGIMYINPSGSKEIRIGCAPQFSSEYAMVFMLLNDNTYSISLVGDLVSYKHAIPNSYNGILVSEINSYAFDSVVAYSREIGIPSGIKTIKAYAFSNLAGLEKIVIPSSVTSIDNDSIYNCNYLNKIEVSENALDYLFQYERFTDLQYIYFKGESSVITQFLKNKDIPKSYYGKRIICNDITYLIYDSFKKYHIYLPDYVTYLNESKDIYLDVFSDFRSIYQETLTETEDLAKRLALMAVTEAKLLETGTFVPMATNESKYKISRVIPNTITAVQVGTDKNRVHQALVVNERPLTKTEVNELNQLFKEYKGSGNYEAKAKEWVFNNNLTLSTTYRDYVRNKCNSFDIFNGRLKTNEYLYNTFDGLYEYDIEGVIKPQLADGMPTISEDGLKYTIKIKDGVKWVDYKGNIIGEVKAEDFVYGFVHYMDADNEINTNNLNLIVNQKEYFEAEDKTISHLGIKAINDKTLEITLVETNDDFLTHLTYLMFAPLPKDYYESHGGKFGSEYSEDCEYGYGLYGYQKVAYCGPYIVESYTTEQLVLKKNPKYWNKDNINIERIVYDLYPLEQTKDESNTFDNLMTNNYAECTLNETTIEKAKTTLYNNTNESWFDLFAYPYSISKTTYISMLNLNRYAYSSSFDTYTKSQKNDNQKELAKAALLEKDFRLAILYSLNRSYFYSNTTEQELIDNSIINTYTLNSFNVLPSDTTIQIEDKSITYTKGTYYAKIVQDILDADGFEIKVFDEESKTSIGFDGWYNPQKARELFNKAFLKLEEYGYEIFEYDSDGNKTPKTLIHIDMAVWSNIEGAREFKKNIEEASNHMVVLNFIEYREGGYVLTGESGCMSNYDLIQYYGIYPYVNDFSEYFNEFYLSDDEISNILDNNLYYQKSTLMGLGIF